MATFIKRRGPDGRAVWQARIRKKGYPQQTKTFNTKAEARTWVVSVEAEIGQGIFVSRAAAENVTLAELLARYGREITPAHRGAAVERIRLRTLAHDPLAERIVATLRSTDFAAWRDGRLRAAAPGTVLREMNLLHHLFVVARREWGIHTPNPLDDVGRPRPPRGRDRRLLLGEEDCLLTACRAYGGPIADLVTLALETAMRRGELASMRWDYLDRKAHVLLIPETKTGEPRRVPLSSRALDVLAGLARRIDGHVWGIGNESISQSFGRAVARARKDYEAECDATGERPNPRMLRDLHFHDLRHEATSRLFEKGLNPMEVAAITGHKTLQMLKRYTHLRAEDLVDRLG